MAGSGRQWQWERRAEHNEGYNYLLVGQISTSPLTTVLANITKSTSLLPQCAPVTTSRPAIIWEPSDIRYRKTLPAFPAVENKEIALFACELRLLCSLAQKGTKK